jgi:hypothetical protein
METEEEADGKIKRSRPTKWTKVVTFHVSPPPTSEQSRRACIPVDMPDSMRQSFEFQSSVSRKVVKH